MTDEQRRGSEASFDERTLDEALGRYLGSAVGEILKSIATLKAHREGPPDPKVVLDEVDDVNPWLGGLLRRAVESPPGRGYPANTNEHK